MRLLLLDIVSQVGDGFCVCRIIGEQYRHIAGVSVAAMLAIGTA